MYVLPPQEGEDTNCDSGGSDDDHEGNVNHLGPKMLQTQCEVIVHSRNAVDTRNKPTEDDDFDTSDEEPLCKYVRSNLNNQASVRSTAKTNL